MPGGTATVTLAGIPVITGVSAGFAAVAVAVGNLAISFALSAALRALSDKPQAANQNTLDPGNRNQNFKQPITAYQVIYGKVRVGGAITFAHVTENAGLFHMVVTIAGHEITAVDEWWVDDEMQTLDGSGKVTSGRWYNLVDPSPGVSNEKASSIRLLAGLGTTAGDSAMLSALVANTAGKWSANHKQEGKAKFYFQGISSEMKQGVPKITAVVRGKPVYDDRISSTTYSNNPALCIRDYLVDTTYGLGEPLTRIDEASFNAAANICEEQVNLNPSGTEDRYTLNGVIDTSNKPKNILESLLGSCAGTLTYQGGKWSLYVGAYRTPTLPDFNESHITGPVTIQTKIGRKEIFNAVKGIYISKDDNYIATDFPAITNATYLTEDQNERIWKDAQFDYTVTSSMAQRLAKIALEQARQQITLALPVNLKGLKAQVGDVVNVSLDRMGFNSKPFEVTKWIMLNKGTKDIPKIGIDLKLRETASTVYDWNLGEETTTDPAPNTDLPDPFAVPQEPTSLLVESGNEGLTTAKDGTVIVNLKASWTDPVETFLSYIETQFKRSSATDWTQGPNVPDAQTILLGPVDQDDTWDVRIRSISTFEKPSAWVSSLNHTVIGKTAPPSEVTAFSFTESPDGTRVYSWVHDNVPADVRAGGGYEIRYFVGTTSSWSSMTKLHSGVLLASPHEDNQLAAGTYTFAIKAIDSSGNESVNAKFVTAVSLNNPRIGSALVTRNETSFEWPGTFINSEVQANTVVGNTQVGQDWSDLPTLWSSMATEWRTILPTEDPFYYTTPEIDLGFDANMSPVVSIQGVGTPLITVQTGTEADGAVTGTVAITSSSVANPSNILAVGHGMVTNDIVEITGHTGSTPDINGFHTITRIDDDNYTIPINVTVGGTGGSSVFYKVPVSEIIRYIKIRVKMSGANSIINEMTTIIDSPSAEDIFSSINTATESRLFFNRIAAGHFQIGSLGSIGTITQASITAIIINAPGYSSSLINTTSIVNGQPAAEFKIWDGSDTLADAIINVSLKGSRA